MKIINAVLFKANWFACVLGGALWGALGVIGLAVFSFVAGRWQRDLVLAAALAAIGFCLDTVWIQLGILDYGTSLAPMWIVLMWVGLAFTINHAMSVFVERPLLGGLLSGGAAPVTCLGGERLGSVVVAMPLGLILVASVWAVLFYAVFRLCRDLDSDLASEAEIVA